MYLTFENGNTFPMCVGRPVGVESELHADTDSLAAKCKVSVPPRRGVFCQEGTG